MKGVCDINGWRFCRQFVFCTSPNVSALVARRYIQIFRWKWIFSALSNMCSFFVYIFRDLTNWKVFRLYAILTHFPDIRRNSETTELDCYGILCSSVGPSIILFVWQISRIHSVYRTRFFFRDIFIFVTGSV